MTANTQSSKSSVSERRGQSLTPLQTNFSRPGARPAIIPTRPNRPRPEEYQNDSDTGERVPLQQTPVKRQSSKSGLRSIFSREKLPKDGNDAKLSGIEEGQDSVLQPTARPPAPTSPTLATPKTTFSTPTTVTSPTSEPLKASKNSKSRQKPSDDKSAAGEIGWKPPPLFQAYPQAIKHDTLLVPSLSADSILRVQATSAAKNSKAQNESSQTENAGARKKESKEKKKHMRTLSETIGKSDWSEKIYVLVTAGYILQYTGSGKYDRLPEKMLQLGPKSVAFASDAIPGKHWVLQISQVTDENNTASADVHRPLFSRLGFHRSSARRLTRSLLLVFNAPEDMSSWLLSVRALIEARGGKKYVSERAGDDDIADDLEAKPSTRQMVRKDPNRFSQTFLQPQSTVGVDDKESTTDQSRRSSYVSLKRRSLVTQPTPESRSETMSTTQTEITSPVSGQARFYSVNPGSSTPNGSVISTGLAALDGPPRSPTFKVQESKPPTIVETPIIPQSLTMFPDPILRSASPPAPNFSVPSFSKRFTARMGQFPHLSRAPSLKDEAAQSDPISAFPSPPHSPIKSIDSFAASESHEPMVPFRDSSQRRSSRISTSEDSLGETQNQDAKLHLASRVPKPAIASSNASQSSRPSSIVDRETGTHHQFAQSPPPTGDPSSRREQRQRVSVFPSPGSNRVPTGPMLRRKSMPGLSGPPAVPPPDCPLPKIPSSIEQSLPDIVEQFPDPRTCASPPPMKGPRLRRKSLANSGRLTPVPASKPVPLQTQSLGSRHPRVVNGI
ncbi:hypothetical protein BDV25DRAFT_163437 [Aspergillus avenaceus]|uniref:Peptidase family M20/M25/M40 protein n=1 Tax=Aspergillus avenaceus TaxID=36643 RepID=A0A5N6TIQ9_ASPAV|nr:hypothetical protein BDV25DRAFT_163437 [Aspergillus avenaceus]